MDRTEQAGEKTSLASVTRHNSKLISELEAIVFGASQTLSGEAKLPETPTSGVIDSTIRTVSDNNKRLNQLIKEIQLLK
jgi:hypothetical protein